MRFPAAAPIYVAARNGGGSTRKALASKPSSCRRDTCPPCREVSTMGSWLDKEGACLASRFMRERYPPVPPIIYCGEGGVVVSAVS